MKRKKLLLIGTFVLAIGSAFTTKTLITPVGKNPDSIPPDECTAGTINREDCSVVSGSPCFVTLPNSDVVQAYDATCVDGNELNHN